MSEGGKTVYRLLLLGPAVFTAAVISGFVIINTFSEGLGIIPELSMYAPDPGLFIGLFWDDVFLSGLGLSLRVAVVSTLLCCVTGVLLAFALCRSKSALLSLGARFPLILSYVAAGILVYNLFSDHGLIYHFLRFLVPDINGLDILYTDSFAGVIILYCFKGAPFVALSVFPVLSNILDSFGVAASNLGAGTLRIWIRIILPLIRHSVAVAALVIFDYQLFTYESYYYLGASAPVALGVYAYRSSRLSDLGSRAAGMAVNTVMVLISLVTLILYVLVMRKETKGTNEE